MEAISSCENKRKDMMDKLAKTNAHFKHQQRGEPDLTVAEKSNIAFDIFIKNPVLFLERFSSFLTLDDVECFNEFKGNYQVDFYVNEILKRCADTGNSVVKNRRFQALQALMNGGEYFSQDEMKWRDPLLYEQMIGQFENQAERTEKIEQEINRSDLRFSTILLKHMDQQANKQYFELLKEQEEGQEEEDESEDDNYVERDFTKNKNQNQEDFTNDECGSEISSVEKAHLKEEFLKIMQERFLLGEDSAFDYSTVDSNADYDALDIVSHDAEEKYFDADEHSDADDVGDSLLRSKLENIDLDNVKDMDDKEEEDYMLYVPSDF